MQVNFLDSPVEITEAIAIEARRANSWSFCISAGNSLRGHSELWERIQPHIGNLEQAVADLSLFQIEPWLLNQLEKSQKLNIIKPDAGTFHTNLFAFTSQHSFSAIVGSLPLTSASSDGGYRSSAILSKCSLDDRFANEVQTFLKEIRDRSVFATRDQLKRYGIQYVEHATSLDKRSGQQRFANDPTVDEMMHTFRKALTGVHKLPNGDFVQRVARALRRRGKKVGNKVKRQIERQVAEAERRGLLTTPTARHIRRKTTRLMEYELREIVDAISAVTHVDVWYKRDDVIGAVCQYLGFQRVTAGMKKHIRSALNSAVRGNVLFADGRLDVMRPYRPIDRERKTKVSETAVTFN